MNVRNYSRRDFVRMSFASAFGAAACPWLPRLAAAAGRKPSKGCIVLWMSGGPSQTDTWDLKPGHKNGGPYKPSATPVAGLLISEHLPKLATAAHHLGIIRSMTTQEGEHGRATQLLHTGQLPNDAVAYPALGSLLAKELGEPDSDLPSYVTVSPPGGFGANLGAGFLGPQYAPMAVSGISDNPNARANLTIDYLRSGRAVAAPDQQTRRNLLAELQGDFEKRYGGPAAAAHAASLPQGPAHDRYRGPRRLPPGGGAREAPRLLWQESVWPGLLARPPAPGARRVLRRGDPRRLGHPPEQLRDRSRR